MTVVSHALGFKRFRQESLELSLLRSDNFPVVLAVVAQYFPQGAIAKPASELYQLLSDDFRVLREEGFELPKSPSDYVSDWVKSRWFVRRPGSSQTGETVEPSEELLAVLDSVQRWDNPHRSISASRIESLTQALQTLALESDPSTAKRLAELERERERIERQIETVHAGEFEVLTTVQIGDRVADILDLAASEHLVLFVQVEDECSSIQERFSQLPGFTVEVIAKHVSLWRTLSSEDLSKAVLVVDWFWEHPNSALLKRAVAVEGAHTKWFLKTTAYSLKR
ncbi:DUF3375 family protein [Corynebacterium glutamicum]|uniref:DUF3375 family protein n=1 Tax=Corynebacterium glutamicum TaxID=1718 RepID=UPI003B5AA984